MERKLYHSLQRVNINTIRRILLIIAFILSTIYPFLLCKAYSDILDEIPFHYFITGCVILSNNYLKIDYFKLLIYLFLPIGLIFRNWLMLWSILFFCYQINAQKIEIGELAKIGICMVSIELFLQLEGVLVGIIESNGTYVIKTLRYAYDLGLGNTNHVGTFSFFFISLLYIVLHKKHIWIFIICTTIFNILVFLYCSSRTFFLGNMVVILGGLFYKFGLFRTWLKPFIAVLPVIMICGLLYVTLNYNEMELGAVNEVSTGRLHLFFSFFSDFSLKDFIIGKPMDYEAPLDNSFLTLLHQTGLISITILCLAYFLTVWKKYETIKQYIPFLSGVLIVSLAENIITSPSPISIIFWSIILTSLVPKKSKALYQNKNNYYFKNSYI